MIATECLDAVLNTCFSRLSLQVDSCDSSEIALIQDFIMVCHFLFKCFPVTYQDLTLEQTNNLMEIIVFTQQPKIVQDITEC